MLINVIIAFFLDLVVGDPVFRYHPVRLIGSMLTLFERVYYRLRWKIFGGLLLVLTAILVVFCIILVMNWAKGFLYLPFSINVLSVILLYFLFCNRDMTGEAKSVYYALEDGDIERARKQVSRIVGRNTEPLDKRSIIRATAESVAENVVDGFTAPLFWFGIGGFPLAYIYKTVNTIDSRFGYRNVRYERFGKVGARLDDVLNFIPARLNGVFLYCASGFRGEVLETMVKYARAHPSPNSGISEAGFSGFLGIRLCGPSTYEGVQKIKPWIGKDRLSEKELEDPGIILKAVNFYWKVITVTLCIFLGALYLLPLPLVFK